jgi:hypothetical protein
MATDSYSPGPGVVRDDSAGDEILEVAAGHTGLAVHDRGDGTFGWFSAGPDGMIYYSQGAVGSVWTTEPTGIEAGDIALDPPVDRYLVDVATRPGSTQPHLAYIDDYGDELRSIALSADGEWRAWSVMIDAYIDDIKATWVGCGRPAVELARADHVPELDAGWYLLQAP